MFKLKHYANSLGDDLFGTWLNSIADIRTRSRIAARLLRLYNGNFGDCKPVGSGVWELRIDTGPGYRVYYAIDEGKVILLCEGGDKRTQKSDIKRAILRWQDWKERKQK